MTEANFCPLCAASRAYGNGSDLNDNCHCGYSFKTAEVIEEGRVSFEHAFAGATVQAQMFTTVMQNLLGVHSVALIEQFWNGLNADSRKHFVQKLLERFFVLLGKGAFDHTLVAFVQEKLQGMALWEALHDGDGLVPGVRRAFAVRAARVIMDRDKDEHYGGGRYDKKRGEFQRELNEALREGAVKAVQEAGAQIAAAHREQLEGLVRDKMPNLEKLAEQVVKDMAQEVIDGVKERVRAK
jgi:hypothetical protein